MHLAAHRPRSVAEIVDVTFAFYRANFVTMVMVAVLVVAPTALLKVAVAPLARLIDSLGNLLLVLGQGAIAAAVAASVERGEVPNVGDAFSTAMRRAGSLIAVQIAAGLMIAIGFLLLIVPGVIAIIWTAVTAPVVVIEQLGLSSAIDRSRALVRGRWRHVLGTIALSWIIALVIVVGAGGIAGLLAVPARLDDLATDMLFALVFPIPAIATSFLYYDLRIRNEGADLDFMISALPTSASTP